MAAAVNNLGTEVNAGLIPRGLSSAENDMLQVLTETLQQLQAAWSAQNEAFLTMNATMSAMYANLSTMNATVGALTLPAQRVQEDKPESSHTSESILLDRREVVYFRWLISCEDSDKLMEMVNDDKYPAQLILQSDSGKTALHVGVKRDCAELVAKLATKCRYMIEYGTSDEAEAARSFPLMVSDEYKLNAFDMAVITGNTRVLEEFKCFRSLNFQYSILGSVREQQPQGIPQEAYEHLKALLGSTSEFLRDKFFQDGYRWGEVLVDVPAGYVLYRDMSPNMCIHLAASSKYWTSKLCSVGDNCTKKDVPLGCAFLERVRGRIGDISILMPLLLVRDSQGRTPLHVCMFREFCLPTEGRKDSAFTIFFNELRSDFPDLDPNVTDRNGRTPLHWAAAQGFADTVALLAETEKTKLKAVFSSPISAYDFSSPLTPLSAMTFNDITALHLATINNHVEVVRKLLNIKLSSRIDVNSTCGITKINKDFEDLSGSPTNGKWTCLQLASLMGHVQILQLLLKDARIYDPGLTKKELKKRKSQASEGQEHLPALHIAAAYSQPSAIKALANCKLIDVSARDKKGNTALHYFASMAGRKVETLLPFYVSWEHFRNHPVQSGRICSEDDIITCMEILMQSGLNMQQINKENEAPILPSSTHISVKQAWLKRIAMEAQETKHNLSAAANAISITAAVVATTSFVGPLQPPLGLSSEENPSWLTGYSRVNHVAVNVFFVCDCFSFYFAIASIIFAMLPSLSIPYEGIWKEVHIAKRCVQIAVLLLFSSIIFVICAFSAASVAIIPGKKWVYKAIAIVCISFGALLCSIILILSLFRLLKLFAANNETIQRLSNAADSSLLWRVKSIK